MPESKNISQSISGSIQTTQTLQTASNFQFSAVGVENMGSMASEYTIVTIVCDTSGSVSSYKNELEKCLKTVVESCQKAPRACNLLLRLVSFNTSVTEIHGFRSLSEINVNEYDNCIKTSGYTALFDAVLSSIESTVVMAKLLQAQDCDSNGVIYVITDGGDNTSGSTAKQVKDAMDKVQKDENLQSLAVILIGVGSESSVVKHLDKFQKDATITQFMNLTELFAKTSPAGALAKLAGMVSHSISTTSQALAGGNSKAMSSQLTF